MPGAASTPEQPEPAEGRTPADEAQPAGIRRIEIALDRPWVTLYAGIRPTLVIGGRGQPTQWGRGTWQVPSDQPVTLRVFLFNRVWRFGQAEIVIAPGEGSAIVYRAPVLPFGRGRLRVSDP